MKGRNRQLLIGIIVVVVLGVLGVGFWRYGKGNMQVEQYQFSVADLFVDNHPVLDEKLWTWTGWSTISQMSNETYEESKSEEGANGWWVFQKGDGITYLLLQYTADSEPEDIAAITITSDKYQLGCGISVGMEEADLQELAIPLREFSEEEVNEFVSGMPLLEESYDVSYGFEEGYITEEDLKIHLKNAGMSEDAYPIQYVKMLVFVKDGKVSRICAFI